MIACKAFEPGLVCRGYRFHKGLNTTTEANCRQNGFHCAANPLDCLTYYNIDSAEFWLVDARGDVDEDEHDSKISCTELEILKKLSKKDFLLFSLAYMCDHPLLKWNGYVQKDSGIARNGFVVVRGVDPIAQGSVGDILALAKESSDGAKIIQICVAAVGGESVMPGVWYDVDLQRSGLKPKKRSA